MSYFRFMFQISMAFNQFNIDGSVGKYYGLYYYYSTYFKNDGFFKHSLANSIIWFSLIVHFSNKIQITIS